MLRGKTAVITGGAKGIGRAIAEKFAQNGANIVVNYNTSDKAALELTDKLDKFDIRVITKKADISDVIQAKNLIDEAVSIFGRIDIFSK